MNRNQLVLLLAAVGLAGGATAWYLMKKRRIPSWSVENTLEEVAQAHAEYLHAKHPAYFGKFEQLLSSDRQAAYGEAVVFSLLKTYFRAQPEPADVPGTGGVDFICRKATQEEFVVEVTSLKPEAVAAQSGIPTTVEETAGGAFKMTTNQLFTAVCGKADQMSGYSCPRVLAITSTHQGASFLMGQTGAEFLLTSEPGITYPVPGSGGPVTMTTNLRRSAFFAPSGNHIVPRRQSVSSVLLIAMDDVRSPAPRRLSLRLRRVDHP